MEPEIQTIKNWLATGSVNIFGLPYSGKDTVGIRLAEILGGLYLSSGLILREVEKENLEVRKTLSAGLFAPQDQFFNIVLPYFSRADLADHPLILGGVGRWVGEENATMEAAAAGGHAIKAALLLNVSEADIRSRWDQARIIQDRGERSDDKELKILDTRISEFQTKEIPVIMHYKNFGLLIPINADQSKDKVFAEVVKKLAQFAASANN